MARTLAENHIACSEILFRSLFENISSGVAIYTAVDDGADFVFKDINHSVEVLENIGKQDVIGKRLTDVFPAVKEFGLFEVLQRVDNTGIAEHFPLSFYHDNRIAGWRDNYVFRLPSGEIVAIYDDVTARKQAETALRESHKKVHALLNSMAEGAYGVDTNGNCTFVNQSFLKILGYDNENEVIGKHIHELTHHSHADGSHYPTKECRMYAAYQRNEEVHCADEVFWRKDGTSIPVEYWSEPIVDDGVMVGAIATFSDITERKRAEAALREAALYSRSLIESSLDPLVTISAEGKITDVNIATEKVTGADRASLIGSDFANYFTDPEEARKGYQQVFSQGSVTDYPLAICHVSGKVTDVLYNASVYKDSEGKVLGVFAAARDVTERKLLEVEFTKQAHLDYLTGLSNRRHFMEQGAVELSRSVRYDTPLSLLMLDIDFFKKVNDTHGHQVGDTVLQVLSKVCQDTMRQVDMVGRLGGEEFAVILPETGSEEAFEVAERLREAIAKTAVAIPAGLPIHFTVSIGVTTLGNKDVNIDTLINQADKALYEAKKTGRNKVCVG